MSRWRALVLDPKAKSLAVAGSNGCVTDGHHGECWVREGRGAPVVLWEMDSARQIGLGRDGRSICVLDTAGGAVCGAYDGGGVSGRGGGRLRTKRPRLEPVQGIRDARDLSVGYHHACVVTRGRVKCWGDNRKGQLGISTAQGSAMPRQLPVPSQNRTYRPLDLETLL